MTQPNQRTLLLHYNRHGLVPGPGEVLSDFIARAEFCLGLKPNPPPQADLLVDSWSDDPAVTLPAWQLTERLYDIIPTWVPIAFHNHGLRPWHGGCTWIFTLTQTTPPAALIQLRKAFLTHTTYLGLYQRHELIAHEAAHIGRMAFQEPQFEEILAYHSCQSPWQRWLGPLFQSPREIEILLLCLLASLALAWLQTPLLWALALPSLLLILGSTRLCLRQRQCQRCLSQLKNVVGNHAAAVLYRLTDHEISTFSSCSLTAITQYARQQAPLSLRWQVIWWAYFDPCEKKS